MRISAALRWAAGWLIAVSATAAAAQSPTISHITVTEGTIGSAFDIVGSGFDALTPLKARLRAPGGEQDAKLVVVARTDTTVSVVLPPGPKLFKGTWAVVVFEPGGVEAVLPMAFAVHAPEIVSIDPAVGVPGDTIRLGVQFLGTGKHRVVVAGKQVTTHDEPGSLPFDPADTHFVDFVIPAWLLDGVHPVSVSNQVASSALPVALTVEGSEASFGQDRLVLAMNGEQIRMKKQHMHFTLSPGTGLVGGSAFHLGQAAISLSFPFDPAAPGVPFDITSADPELSFTCTFGGFDTLPIWSFHASPEQPFTLHVHAVKGHRLSVSFAGTLKPGFGPPIAMLPVIGSGVLTAKPVAAGQ